MPVYTINVTLEVTEDSIQWAYRAIQKALERAKLAEIRWIDSDVTDTRPDDEE